MELRGKVILTNSDPARFPAVLRIKRPSTAELRRLAARRKPVVIEGAIAPWVRSGAWTLENIAARAGSTMVRAQVHGEKPGHLEYRDMSFRALAESIRNGADTKERVVLASFPVTEHLPELAGELADPPYPQLRAPRAFIAPAGACMPLHWDVGHGFIAELVGKKRVVLASIAWRELLVRPELLRPGWLGAFDVEALDGPTLAGMPAMRRAECTLAPGDLLFLPAGVRHFTRSIDHTVSLSFFWYTPVLRIARQLLRAPL